MDGPHYEALASAAVAGSVHFLDVRVVLAGWRLDVAARVLGQVQVLQQLFLGSHESHGQEDEIAFVDLLSSWYLDHLPSALVVLFPLDLDRVDSFDVSMAVVDELLE